MTSRHISVDWKMAAGFGGLLFLIVAIGVMGIVQIQSLSRAVSLLARVDVPRQNAVSEMKSSNSQYAMSIRSYMFWRNSKYLDAVSTAGRLDLVRRSLENFDKHLDSYALLSPGEKQQEWVRTIRTNQKELKSTGDKIIKLIDQMETVAPEQRKSTEDHVNKSLMDFEKRIFAIDATLDDPVQEFNKLQIEWELEKAIADKKRSVTFLTWSLLIGLGLGAQTAHLIYRRSKREKEHREMLCRTVIRVEEEEKNKLSLQIHDQMGQDLSALKIYLGLVDKELPADMKEPKEKITKTKKILDDLMTKIHNVSELLRPPEIDDLGIIESISALLVQYQEMTQAEYRFLKPTVEIKLSPEYSLVLYRVVQEALTNIAKYSNARKIEVSLQGWDDAVYLTVADDGVGFDFDEYAQRPTRRKEDKAKLGLQGLRQRIELFGGTMTITTRPGSGTKLAVMLPT